MIFWAKVENGEQDPEERAGRQARVRRAQSWVERSFDDRMLYAWLLRALLALLVTGGLSEASEEGTARDVLRVISAMLVIIVGICVGKGVGRKLRMGMGVRARAGMGMKMMLVVAVWMGMGIEVVLGIGLGLAAGTPVVLLMDLQYLILGPDGMKWFKLKLVAYFSLWLYWKIIQMVMAAIGLVKEIAIEISVSMGVGWWWIGAGQGRLVLAKLSMGMGVGVVVGTLIGIMLAMQLGALIIWGIWDVTMVRILDGCLVVGIGLVIGIGIGVGLGLWTWVRVDAMVETELHEFDKLMDTRIEAHADRIEELGFGSAGGVKSDIRSAIKRLRQAMDPKKPRGIGYGATT